MAQKKYFDPDSGEEITPQALAKQPNVKISEEGYGQMALNPEIGGVYTGFGAPPRQKAPLPTRSPISPTDIPETPKDKFFGAVAATPRVAKQVTDWGLDKLADPEVLAGLGAGYLTGGLGLIPAMLASGGATASVAAAREGYSASKEGRQANYTAPLATGMASGMINEAGGRMLMAPFRVRPEMTPAGSQLKAYFDAKNVPYMANQLTDSPGLNFAANFAKYAPTSKHIVQDIEEQQGSKFFDDIHRAALEMSPNQTIPLTAEGTLNTGVSGQLAQKDIAEQLIEAPKTSGFPEFMSKYGKARKTKTVDIGDGGPAVTQKGPTVEASHKTRSELLAESRNPNISRAERQDLLRQASGKLRSINEALPDETAREEYKAIATKYKTLMGRIDNPTTEALRTGVANDIPDQLLDSKLYNYENLKTKTGHTFDDLLGKVQSALSPEAWGQLQADTVYRAAERAIDKNTGFINADALQKIINNIDEPTRKRLFGKSLPDVSLTAKLLSQAQKYHKDEAGRLFAAIRTGGAITALTTGAVTGNIGKGAVGSALVLASPKLLAKVLTSPIGHRLLVRSLGSTAKPGTVQASRALVAWLTKAAGEELREAVVAPEEVQQESVAGPDTDMGIPEPPQ